MKKSFNKWELDFIRLTFPLENNKEIAKILNRRVDVISRTAHNMGIYKFCKIKKEQRFGKLIIINLLNCNKKGCRVWLCKCDCGNTKEISSEYLLKSGIIKSCGCYATKIKSSNTKFVTGSLFTSLKHKAKRWQIPFKVDIDYLDKLFIKQDGKCALSNIKLNIPKGRIYDKKLKYKELTASFDRIDSSKGYIEDNIQFVHKYINIMKNNYKENYFIWLCHQVAKNNNITNIENIDMFRCDSIDKSEVVND